MKNLTFVILCLFQCLISAPFIIAQHETLPVSFCERIIIDTDREVYVAGETIHFKISLFQNQSFAYSHLSKYAYVMLVNETGQNILKFQVGLSNGIYFSSCLLPDTISTGLYRLIGYTNMMRNCNTENYALRNLFVANRFDQNFESRGNKNIVPPKEYRTFSKNDPFTLSLLKPEYRCGDSIILTVILPDSGVGNAGISISIAENTPAGNFNINRYLEETLHGDEIISDFRFPPEKCHPVLQGFVQKKNNPLPGARILLTSPDSIVSFQYATTDAEGVFRFQLSNYYNDRKLVLTSPDQADSNLSIRCDEKYISVGPDTLIHFKDNLSEYIFRSQKIVTIQKTYCSPQPFKITDYKREMPPMLYMKPRSKVFLSDYIQLKDLADISLEILPPVKIIKNDKKSEIVMYNATEQVFFETKPLILFNGVPVDKLNQILNFGSKDISCIEMVDEPWIFGELDFQGVLALFSADYSLDKISMGANNLILHNPGPYQSFRFEELSYDNNGKPDHFPDFRQLLYWNPDVAISYEKPFRIKLKAPQNEGVFKIKIHGITSNNKPLTSCHTFLVKK